MSSNEDIQTEISLGDKVISRSDYESALAHYLNAAFQVVTIDWHIPVRQKIRSLLSADIDGDGIDEVLYGTEGHLLSARKSNKEELWSFGTDDWVTGIDLVDINGDGDKEIIVASDKLYILNKNGILIQDPFAIPSRASSLKIYCAGKKDGFIAVGDKKGQINCYDFRFNIIGSFKTDGNVIDLAIGDFDGDGDIEIAAASEDRYVYIIDKYGNEKDRIHVNHWIINMDSIKLNANKSRLYIGEFQGVTHIYKPKAQSGQSISLSSILDLKVQHLFDKMSDPQFIVGASDRQLSFFDNKGNLIWSFESGLGQRAISIKKLGNGQLKLFVGTESGEVFSYSIQLVPDLVSKIKNAYEKLNLPDLMDIKIDPEKLKVLRYFIKYNPIKPEASIKQAENFAIQGNMQKAVFSTMETWWNNCEYIWEYETQGRVYDIIFSEFQPNAGRVVLAGSEDGHLYCVNRDKTENWSFLSPFGRDGEIRGVFAERTSADSILVASADKSLYMLDSKGIPVWNFQHLNSILFTYAGRISETDRMIFVGTEDHKVLAFDDDGLLLWSTELGERVRAITFCNDNEGHSYVIAGSDDYNVYIINCGDGNINHSFSTPHYVLVVHAQDIDNDGIIEIITGNENGHLHVFDFSGNLLWRFETGSWVAALDVYKNKTGEIEIIIGSQDNNLYALNKNGALLWQYETAARVRTLCVDTNTDEVAFGSYDKKFYLIKRTSRDTTANFISELYQQSNNMDVVYAYKNSPSRYERAFFYLLQRDVETLKDGLIDHSDIVVAAAAYSILENFITSNQEVDLLSGVLSKSSRRVRATLFSKIGSLLGDSKIKKRTAFKIINSVIKSNVDSSSRIDAFRHWATMVSDPCDVLAMAKHLIPSEEKAIDEFVIDELNHACLMALKLYSISEENISILDAVDSIASIIKEKFPTTATKIREAFA